MSYCPRCRSEYEQEMESCPDCGVQLVAELADRQPPSRDEDALVQIADVANEGLAAVWVETLKSRGIPCLAKASGANIGGWGYSALLPHYLYVRNSDRKRALRFMRLLAGDDPSVGIKDQDITR